MTKLLLTGIAALFLATGTAHAEDVRCDLQKAIRYQCGDKLVCITIGSKYTVTDIKTGRRLPRRSFIPGPRGGFYGPGKDGAKCLGGV